MQRRWNSIRSSLFARTFKQLTVSPFISRRCSECLSTVIQKKHLKSWRKFHIWLNVDKTYLSSSSWKTPETIEHRPQILPNTWKSTRQLMRRQRQAKKEKRNQQLRKKLHLLAYARTWWKTLVFSHGLVSVSDNKRPTVSRWALKSWLQSLPLPI